MPAGRRKRVKRNNASARFDRFEPERALDSSFESAAPAWMAWSHRGATVLAGGAGRCSEAVLRKDRRGSTEHDARREGGCDESGFHLQSPCVRCRGLDRGLMARDHECPVRSENGNIEWLLNRS
jgi:hypothetical protein